MDRCGYGSVSNSSSASASSGGGGGGGSNSAGSSSGGRLRRSDVRRGEFPFFLEGGGGEGVRGLAATKKKKEKLKKNSNSFPSQKNKKKGRLLAALRALDAEDDVNRVTAYFSYEHFYVIYCKFWVRSHRDFFFKKVKEPFFFTN